MHSLVVFAKKRDERDRHFSWRDNLYASNNLELPTASGFLPCQKSSAERRLKIEAPNRPVEIENLPGKVKIRRQLAFHRPRVDFVERDAAGSHLGLLEPQ